MLTVTKIQAKYMYSLCRHLCLENNQYVFCNADIKDRSQFETFDKLQPGIKNVLNGINKKLDLTPRQQTRLLVSRTVADLDTSSVIQKEHIVSLLGRMSLQR
jgi:predicted ATPase with chaperone activity